MTFDLYSGLDFEMIVSAISIVYVPQEGSCASDAVRESGFVQNCTSG